MGFGTALRGIGLARHPPRRAISLLMNRVLPARIRQLPRHFSVRHDFPEIDSTGSIVGAEKITVRREEQVSVHRVAGKAHWVQVPLLTLTSSWPDLIDCGSTSRCALPQIVLTMSSPPRHLPTVVLQSHPIPAGTSLLRQHPHDPGRESPRSVLHWRVGCLTGPAEWQRSGEMA